MARSTQRGPGPRPAPARGAGRGRAAADRAAALPRAVQRRKRLRWAAAAAVVAALAFAAGGYLLATRGGDTAQPTAAPVVGGDLHTVTAIGDAVYVGGHAAVAVSHDGGHRWQDVPSLKGADAMGWAVTPDAVLAGGHPGLFRSTDSAVSFQQVTGAAAVPDVHALGAAGTTAYLASPQAGLLASSDGGSSWQVRNAQAGRSFMGTILVDPADPNRLIASDMSAGLTTSSDGGRSWRPLGGPTGAMAAAWNPTNIREIIAVGMNGAAVSTDGGTTWHQLQLPAGVSAVGYAPDGQTAYAGALDGERARVYRSTDRGATWAPTA